MIDYSKKKKLGSIRRIKPIPNLYTIHIVKKTKMKTTQIGLRLRVRE